MRRQWRRGRLLAGAVLAFAASLVFTPASAHLVPMGTVDLHGTGLGAVYSVLTLTSPGNSTTETASVAWSTDHGEVIEGDALRGASQTRVVRIGNLGLTDASNLRIIFNSQEPADRANNDIALSNLVLSIFSPNGVVLFDSGLFTPVTLPATDPGIGQAGFVFALDSDQAAAAQDVFAPGNLIGLLATLEDASGGPETFFVGSLDKVVAPQQIPEPRAAFLAGLVLLSLGATARRRLATPAPLLAAVRGRPRPRQRSG
ncbi:MAG TPA: hypothetical protein VFB54_05560 [Burkholderiales bacterium]|nr:hypothetical protein [Burkholderiales bacterium]